MPEDPVPPFAEIEDLDADQGRGTPSARRWEWLLGLALVLGLAGFALAQWWGDSSQQAHYQSGARAVAAGDWDTALAAFRSAAGYRDADKRAADAAALVTARNGQYAIAVQAATAGDWLRALSATRWLQKTTPAYRDAAQLDAEVTRQVYAAALGGTVLMRSHGTPAGLYYYGPPRGRLLPGSDGRSRLDTRCPGGELLYDVPPEGAPSQAAPPLSPPASPGAGLAARRLRVSSAAGVVRLDVPPGSDIPDLLVCTTTGLWRENIVRDLPRPDNAPYGPPAFRADYVPFGGTTPVAPRLPGPDWYLLGIAPDGRQILLIDTTGVDGAHWQSRVYLAAPDGSGRRLLDARPGVPRTADFSPDGRYVLLTLDPPPAGTGADTATALLFDTSGGHAPRALTEWRVGVESQNPGSLAALFVHRGARAGQIFMTWAEGDSQVVRLVDPGHLVGKPSYIPAGTGGISLSFITTDSPDGAVLAGWMDQSAYGSGQEATILYLDGQNRGQVLHPPLIPGDDLTGGWVRAGRLVYNDQVSPVWPSRSSLRSLPLSGLSASPLQPTEIYSGTDLVPESDNGTLYHLGSGLLAYLTPEGELHARSYDGAQDTVLESVGPGAAFLEGWQRP